MLKKLLAAIFNKGLVLFAWNLVRGRQYIVEEKNRLISTGIIGLDEILKGGLIPERFYLVRGGPGTGKTTLGLHFLTGGLSNKEDCLLVTMTEPIKKIKEDGKKFGFDIDNINFVDLSPQSDFIQENKDYDVFPSSQLEQKPLIEKLTAKIEKIKPHRLFFDGITQLKYLASDEFNFRKQILSFMQFIERYNTTILLTSEIGAVNTDEDLQYLSDGIINLNYKNQHHSLEITKYRGSSFNKGSHSFKFKKNGIEVYPRLSVSPFNYDDEITQISSGVPEIDMLLHGGIEKGTTTTITGPSGVGKTTLGTQFIKAGAEEGLKSIIYTFEENKRILLQRAKAINIPLDEIKESDHLLIKKVDPLEYTPDEFSYVVREDVEKNEVSIVMIDSVSGYFLSFGSDYNERDMIKGLHALCEYLKNRGITVIMLNELKKITGDFKPTDYGISYLADNIIFLRYLEVQGMLKKAIGVLKKRMSDFENTMREFKITNNGIKVGAPLKSLRGVLSGNPEIIDNQEDK